MENKEHYEDFADVMDIRLRTYNRVATFFNIINDADQETGQEYLDKFSDVEKKQMLLMAAYIKQHGLEQTYKEVTRGLTVVDSK